MGNVALIDQRRVRLDVSQLAWVAPHKRERVPPSDLPLCFAAPMTVIPRPLAAD